MIKEYSEFKETLDNIVSVETKSKLLISIAENPDRYIGDFRLTSPKMKLLQNITQSNEIKFGDFMEKIVTVYLRIVL